MGSRRMAWIAGVYAFFQFLMPVVGWVCVHTIVELFSSLEKLIPWIAFALLGWIGGKMLWEGLREAKAEDKDAEAPRLTGKVLLLQGVATSIDALSVGFTTEQYDWKLAALASVIIAAVTFVICVGGLILGKKVGMRFSRHASILGGIILIAIGFKILLGGL